MDGIWIRKPENDLAIIFVHGILSNTEKCWTNNNGVFWPKLLEKENHLEKCGIYLYNYFTGISSGSYSISNIVDDFRERIFILDLVANYKNIIFVCHSMGGIIARKLIVDGVLDFIERKNDIGLFLVASPSLGSEYANWLEPIAKLAGHKQAKALRFSQDNEWLNDLDKQFFNLKESKKIKISGKELIEDKFIKLKKLNIFPQVVAPYSASRYFAHSIKIAGSDHNTIAKPPDERSIQHRLLCTFISDKIENEKIENEIIDIEELMDNKETTEYFKTRLDKSLSTFRSQPTMWVEPILSSCPETEKTIAAEKENYIKEILEKPKSTLIKAPPQYGLTCLSHYMALSAWTKKNNSLWLYLDCNELTPYKSAIEKLTNKELKITKKIKEDIECVILDSWNSDSDETITILNKVCEYFEEVPLIVMTTVNDLHITHKYIPISIPRKFETLYLWSQSRSGIRKIITDYNLQKSIGNDEKVITRLISDLDVLNIPRTPLNCFTLLKALEIDFQESPINRAEIIQRVLFILFNVDQIPTYESRPDLKDCEHVLGYYCEKLLKENKFIFSKKSFIEDLSEYCKNRYIDLDINTVFEILSLNNIIISHENECRFKYSYWICYFIAQRMSHNKEFASYILEDMKYAKFPEVIEFYTGIDRQREDALNVLIRDIRNASDRVQEVCGFPQEFDPFKFCKWQPTEQMLEKMQDEIANGVQGSNLPDSIKDSYADQLYDRTRPYNQEIKEILNEYSYVLMEKAMKAGSRALRNSDYVNPEIKKSLLKEIMKCWEEICKVLIILAPFLADEGTASFGGQNFTLRGNFGNEFLIRMQRIIFSIPFNIANFNGDDLFSQKMGPLLIDQIKNENNDLTKHILTLLLINQRPRGWKKEIEHYISEISHDSFYLWSIYHYLRGQYQYSFCGDHTLKEIEYLIKLSNAKHFSGRKFPKEKQINKVKSWVIPTREGF